MQGIILCGGYGTRLRPITYTVPKPLVKLGQHTLLDYILINLNNSKVDKVYLAVEYLKEKIISHIDKVKDNYNFEIDFLYGKHGDGTAGAILNARDLMDENFFVTVGDNITNINFDDFYKHHVEHKALVSIAAREDIKKYDYGVLDLANNKVIGFREKPETKFIMNTGAFCFKHKIFDYIEMGEDISGDVFPKVLKQNQQIYCYMSDFFWYDIGTLKKYNYYKRNLHYFKF